MPPTGARLCDIPAVLTEHKNDTATMNIWLHKQVMQKLADNGGKVPDDLRK